MLYDKKMTSLKDKILEKSEESKEKKEEEKEVKKVKKGRTSNKIKGKK